MKDLYPIIGKKKFDIKNVIILGGSSIGRKNSKKSLCQEGFKVKLIEKDKEKAEILQKNLDSVP